MRRRYIYFAYFCLIVMFISSSCVLNFGRFKQGHYYREVKDVKATHFNFKKVIPSLDEYIDFMRSFAANYSYFATLYRIGKVYVEENSKNYPVYDLAISSGHPKPVIIFVGGLLGEDLLSPLSLMTIFAEWLTNDKDLMQFINLFDYHFIPMANPREYKSLYEKLVYGIEGETDETYKVFIKPDKKHEEQNHIIHEEAPYNPKLLKLYLKSVSSTHTRSMSVEINDKLHFSIIPTMANYSEGGRCQNLMFVSLLDESSWPRQMNKPGFRTHYPHSYGFEILFCGKEGKFNTLIISSPFNYKEIIDHETILTAMDQVINFEFTFHDKSIDITIWHNNSVPTNETGGLEISITDVDYHRLKIFRCHFCKVPIYFILERKVHPDLIKSESILPIIDMKTEYLDARVEVKPKTYTLFNFNENFKYNEDFTYGGQKPFTKSESRILRNFFATMRDRIGAIFLLFSPIEPKRNIEAITYPEAVYSPMKDIKEAMDFVAGVGQEAVNRILNLQENQKVIVCESYKYHKRTQYGRMDDWLYAFMSRPIINLNFYSHRMGSENKTREKLENLRLKTKYALEAMVHELYWNEYSIIKKETYFKRHFHIWPREP